MLVACVRMGMAAPLRADADDEGTKGQMQLVKQHLRHHPRRPRQFLPHASCSGPSWGLRRFLGSLMVWLTFEW